MISCVLVAVRVRATPERAFDVFVREIERWWGPSGLFRTTDQGDGAMKFVGGPGGRLITVLPDGREFEIGRITTWQPGRKLAFTWHQESFAPTQSTDVEVRFEPMGEETRVTVEHRGWGEIPQEHAARHGFPERPFLERAAEWWQANLGGYRAFIAERTSDGKQSS
ncbi:MAG TPA: SRPBCC domain-containing protein [Woeseiaceae bacterium]|jgi:uncharacterized protein YndB with AHSA1/START domain|nr:SRPBCC domain-containing protein [Woeseiaceae bacterium]